MVDSRVYHIVCLVRVLIDDAIEKNKVKMEEMEKSRDALLGEMSNWLHPRYSEEKASNSAKARREIRENSKYSACL